MKTLKSLGLAKTSLLLFSLFVIAVSCKKSDVVNNDDATSSSVAFEVASTSSSSSASVVGADVDFCSEKTVPLCSSGTVVGSFTTKRGDDNKVYLTYAAANGYSLVQVNLFAGLANMIPSLLSSFPNQKSFAFPYNNKEYTFALSNSTVSGTFTIAAYAILVKKGSNGMITGVKIAWADGCNGTPILCENYFRTMGAKAGNTSASRSGCGCDNEIADGVMFTYDGLSCAQIAATVAEPEICARPVPTYFGVHPVYGVVMNWPCSGVTVAGASYTEDEGRAIANTTDVNGVVADSKFAYTQVATLKLSNCEYTLSPSLTNAVNNVESWLATKGKLSASNLPTGNASVRASAQKIADWINTHVCPERR